jgi:Ca2+/H+ antiporter, TMEM165/GDT1 family
MYRRFSAGRVLVFILIGAAAILIFGGAIMWLWNNVLAVVVNVHAISFWQALGLLVLSKLLFGGFRGGWRGRGYWRQRMRQKWNSMTPQEKEKFSQEWQRRCGGWDTEKGSESGVRSSGEVAQ